ILFGVAQDGEAPWDGSLTVDGGEVLGLEGYRFEPPDRVLPAGGWRVTVRPEVMETGEIIDAVGGSAVETVVMPKGLLVRGSGSEATRVRVTTAQGDFEFHPMRLDFGEWQAGADEGARVQRIPPATDLSGTELRQHDFPSVAARPDGSLAAVWMSYHDRREE